MSLLIYQLFSNKTCLRVREPKAPVTFPAGPSEATEINPAEAVPALVGSARAPGHGGEPGPTRWHSCSTRDHCYSLQQRRIPGKGIGTGLSPETAHAETAEPYRVSDVPEPVWACGRGGFSPPGIRRAW